jgi:hypothetical protein
MAWRPAASLKVLRTQVDQRAPARSRASDGTIGDAAHQSRTSDHNAWVQDGGVGVVTAIDITHDPLHGCDAGLLAHALANSRDRRIKYIIWSRQILSSTVQPWLWRPYIGSNPHVSHIHLSVLAEKDRYDSVVPWSI